MRRSEIPAERRQRDGHLIRGHGQRLAVKISAADHFARAAPASAKHERIVRRAVEFDCRASRALAPARRAPRREPAECSAGCKASCTRGSLSGEPMRFADFAAVIQRAQIARGGRVARDTAAPSRCARQTPRGCRAARRAKAPRPRPRCSTAISASRSASASSASIACVPFSSARPSLASSASGAISARLHRFARRASCGLEKSPRLRRSPPARDARAARDRPTRPPSLATESPGCTPLVQHCAQRFRHDRAHAGKSLGDGVGAQRQHRARFVLRSAARPRRTRGCAPDSPAARDSARAKCAPKPFFRSRCSRRKRPRPIAISRSITAREAFMRSRAAGDISTCACSSTISVKLLKTQVLAVDLNCVHDLSESRASPRPACAFGSRKILSILFGQRFRPSQFVAKYVHRFASRDQLSGCRVNQPRIRISPCAVCDCSNARANQQHIVESRRPLVAAVRVRDDDETIVLNSICLYSNPRCRQKSTRPTSNQMK